MKTRIITKHYDKLRQAEAYQTRLCNRYDYVRLIGWPRFTNNGNYTWEVKTKP